MPASPASAAVRERTTCRVCGRSTLISVMDFGEQCIAGAFRRPDAEQVDEPRYPLELVRCDAAADADACGLVQLRHSVRGDLLYETYWYRSGVNQTMTENLHQIAEQANDLIRGLSGGDLVIDVGCNDGTLLDGYASLAPDGVDYLGIDPSDMTRYARDKGYEVVNDFFSHAALESRWPGRRAKLITSIAMFYDLEDPLAFVRDVAASLAQDGVWVSEFSYMPTMLEMNSFDTVCHEHLEYYSLAVIERLLAEAGLWVLRVELNEVNGGSIRLFAGHAGGREVDPQNEVELRRMREHETELALDTDTPFAAFRRNAEAVRHDLTELLTTVRAEGKSVHVYGASTKGNTTLQYAGIDNAMIDCAADRNPDKWGSETIGTHIPIVSEAESRARRPDYYLVLPWHFLDEMLARETEFFEQGGRFIVPLPEVRVVDGSGRRV